MLSDSDVFPGRVLSQQTTPIWLGIYYTKYENVDPTRKPEACDVTARAQHICYYLYYFFVKMRLTLNTVQSSHDDCHMWTLCKPTASLSSLSAAVRAVAWVVILLNLE